MTIEASALLSQPRESLLDAKLKARRPNRWTSAVFFEILAGGLIYSGSQLLSDLARVKSPSTFPFLILDMALLVLTCTGVSFAHGSNDGQKGMGLIMLIH